MASDNAHVAHELKGWMELEGKSYTDLYNEEEERFVFKEVFTIRTCDPKLGAKQITHTNTQEERFLSGEAENGTLAQVLSRQFDTDRLDGDNAHKLRPGRKETAVAERWCRLVSLPHTLYVSLVHHKYDADVGNFVLQPKSVNYPERIDFGYPPYHRWLAEGVEPRAYQLQGVFVGQRDAQANYDYVRWSYIRGPAPTYQWYEVNRAAEMDDYVNQGTPVPTKEVMLHTNGNDPAGTWAFCLYYVQETPGEHQAAAAARAKVETNHARPNP